MTKQETKLWDYFYFNVPTFNYPETESDRLLFEAASQGKTAFLEVLHSIISPEEIDRVVGSL